MKQLLSLLTMILIVAAFSGCGSEHEPSDADHDGREEHGDDHEGHDHEGDDHEGHDHDDDDDEHDHGERHELGKAQAGSFQVTVAVFGEIEAGHEAILDIEVEGGACTAVRAWVGIESGRGSMKAKVDGEDGTYHGHIDVPSSLPTGSAIWIEPEAADGTRSRASFAIPGR